MTQHRIIQHSKQALQPALSVPSTDQLFTLNLAQLIFSSPTFTVFSPLSFLLVISNYTKQNEDVARTQGSELKGEVGQVWTLFVGARRLRGDLSKIMRGEEIGYMHRIF